MKIELPHHRKDAPVICAACGRRVARKARQQITKKANGASENRFLSTDTRASPNPHFLSNKNNELQVAKSGSSIPLNVLGGYRWPGAVPVDSETMRKIVRAEVGST